MAYLALYREWRPQTFGEIIGQEHITRTLKNAVEAGRVGHAYLFCGTRGTGKTTTAKVLAKALNCPHREGSEPCNRCDGCIAITGGLSVDVIEVDAASNRGIDEIRDLREKVKFAPTVGQFRVYIIDEVHMLTNEAFNALLKTLEEPPRHAVFILATTEPHKVPLTILSRCQRFDFRRIVPADIIKRLEEVAAGAKLEVEEEALRLIARAAEGGLRDALSILDQGAAFGGMKITAGDVHNILGTVQVDALSRMAGHLAAGEAGPALCLVGELIGEGKDLRLFARVMAGYLRALLLEKISPGASAEEAWDDSAQMVARASEFSEEGLIRAVEVLADAEQGMKGSTLPGIILELALVKACRSEARSDVASLAARLAALEAKLKVFDGGEGPTGTRYVLEPPPQYKHRPSPESAKSDTPPGGMTATGTVSKKAPVTAGVKPSREIAAEPPRQQKQAEGKNDGEELKAESVPLERVREAWGNMMDTLRKERLPLYHNYVKAVPLLVKGLGLVVGFPEGETLDREMAERPGNKKYLENLLGKFFEGEWQVAFKYYQGKISLPEKRQDKEPVVAVKRRFGGEEITLEEETEGTLF